MFYINKLTDSIKELKSIKNIIILGLLTAIYVVLSYFNIYLLPTVRLSFNFIPLALAGAMFGPVCGAFVGTVGDLLGYLTSQFAAGGFNPGFTINALLTGFIYGEILYKSDFGLLRIFTAKIIVATLVEICLTPIWLSLMYGKAYFVIMVERIIKTLVFIPIEAILINLIGKKIYKFALKQKIIGN